MGDVYLAEHTAIGKPVAIKVLNADLAHRPELVERFLLEARSASMVRHDNIVDITDFGHLEDGTPFFVMEYMAGEDLRSKLAREGRLSWAQAKPLVLQILAALAAAHDAGVIHRDMKPDNCFCLARHDDEGRRRPDLIKVMDFGIAKVVTDGHDQDLTQTGVVIGTASYMSPEQAQSHGLDARTDIYSVGVILYQMLTGGVPFKASGFMGVLSKHITETPEPLEIRCPEVDAGEELSAIVMRALAKDPSERPSTAREFAGLLRAQTDVQPARGRAGASGPRPWIKVALGAGALIVLGVTGMFLAPVLRGGTAEAGEASGFGAAQLDVVRDDDGGPLASADPRFSAPGRRDGDGLLAMAPESNADEVGEPAEAEAELAPAEPASPEPLAEAPAPKPTPAPTKRRKSSKKRRGDRGGTAKASSAEADPLAGASGDDTESPIFARKLHPAISKLEGVAVVCGQQHGGLPGVEVKVRLTVTAQGAVDAVVAKPFSGTPLGKCIEKAMRDYDMGRGAPASRTVSVPVRR